MHRDGFIQAESGCLDKTLDRGGEYCLGGLKDPHQGVPLPGLCSGPVVKFTSEIHHRLAGHERAERAPGVGARGEVLARGVGDGLEAQCNSSLEGRLQGQLAVLAPAAAFRRGLLRADFLEGSTAFSSLRSTPAISRRT
jgi:hypothetical protein